MPVSVTPQQLRAIETLDWLFSDALESRRTGRSWAIAFAIVRKLARDYPSTSFVNIWDHVDRLSMRQVILEMISELAIEFQLPIEVDRNNWRVRNTPTRTIQIDRIREELNDLRPDYRMDRAGMLQDTMATTMPMAGPDTLTVRVIKERLPPPKDVWAYLNEDE